MGFVLEGYFIGADKREFKNNDGSIDVRWYVNVATGSLAYRVSMADDFDPSIVSDLKPGDMMALSLRCYVGKNGKLCLVDGKMI